MADLKDYDDPGYRNWLRACLGLKYLKKGLFNFVDTEIKQLHADIITNVCGSRACNLCTTDFISKNRSQCYMNECPDKVCHLIREAIQDKHLYHVPCWKNSDATKWCTDYWEIGKCFMSPGYDKVSTPAETDCAGFLSVCINGTFLPSTIRGQIVKPLKGGTPANDIFHKNRAARNTLLHSGTMSLSDAEREGFIQDMIDLLTSYEQPIGHAVHDAISGLRKLETDIVIISKEDELGVLKARLDALETQMTVCQTDIQRATTDLNDKIANADSDVQKLWQKQQTDTCIIKDQIEKNSESLALVCNKLGTLQRNLDEGTIELKTALKALKGCQSRNEIQRKELADRLVQVKSLEDRVSTGERERIEIRQDSFETQAQVKSHEIRIGKVEEEMAELKQERLPGATDTAQDKENQLKDIQKYLLEKYKDLSTISMSPLLQRVKANIDDIYSELLIRDDLVHKDKKQSKRNTNVTNYQAILNDGNEPCKNIFVVGTAGIGKTTWSRKLVRTWCDVISKDENTTVSSINQTTLQNYDLVFYIELRRAKAHTHLTEMIETQLFSHKPDLMTQVNTLMESDEDSSRCLIVLDGLDEWVSRAQSTTTDGLPARDPRWKCTIITTTRSWKLEELQLEPQKIDRAVEIKGLKGDVADQLVKKVISTLNASTGQNKDVNEFRAQCNKSIRKCMNVPLLLNIFVCLWYEEGHIDELLAKTFCGLLELLIKHAEGDYRKGLYQKVSPNTLKKATQEWKKVHMDVPDCLLKRRRCSEYAPLLNRLGKIAFDHLFSSAREGTLVFTYQSINTIITEDELQIALDIGILSQTIHCGESVLEDKFSLSFLHKTVQEYLAALYMVYDYTQSNACLNTYQEYCTDVYQVFEMENVLMFVSGMCPEMAGKMSCHIATMERAEWVHQMLLRCVRQERMASSTSRHIYIKHHFLYSIQCGNTHYEEYNKDTFSILNESTDKDITLFMNQRVEDKILVMNCMAEVRHVFVYVPADYGMVDMSGCKSLTTVHYHNHSIDPLYLPTEQLEKIEIAYYEPNTEPVLDLSGCKSLRTVSYKASTARIQLPTEQLMVVEITDYKPSAASLLDLSGCKSLKTVHYEGSTVPIKLQHTEQLKELNIIDYKPNAAAVLDLSGCKSLKILRYKKSTASIHLPSERMEKINIRCFKEQDLNTHSEFDMSVRYENSTEQAQIPIEQLHVVAIDSYKPNTEPVMDLSGCKSLKTVQYKQSTAPIQLPTEKLEEVDITEYTTRTVSVLDLSGCASLRTVQYRRSTAQIQLPTEKLEKVVIADYKPPAEAMLDFSSCTFLRTVHYKRSTAPIQLPTEKLEKVLIAWYQPNTATVLDLSGCKSLRTMYYKWSTAIIQLPTEQLEEVQITDYKSCDAPVLDLSGCKYLKTVQYEQSTVPIQLPTEQLKEVKLTGYKSNTAPVLDLSGCISLRVLSYWWSTVPIQLPTEQLETVELIDCKPCTTPVLDLSKCKFLRTVQYWRSTTPIQLPPERLEKVEICYYKPSAAPVLDLSGCKSLKTVRYKQSTAPIHLPSERLEEINIQNYKVHDFIHSEFDLFVRYEHSAAPTQVPIQRLQEHVVEIESYKPNTTPVLDLSECRSLRNVRYKPCTAPIHLSCGKLDMVDITGYKPSTAPVLDLSGCKSLKTVRYKQSTAPIHLPSERLEEINIQNYKVHDFIHSEFDLFVRYEHSTAPIQVPIQRLQEHVVAIESYKPSTAPVLDLSGCKYLRTVNYKQSTAPIQLPTERLETVEIADYTPSIAPWHEVLDLSGCKSLKHLEYLQSTVPIKLPTEQLKMVEIIDYKPKTALVLDLSGCTSMTFLNYHGSSIPIKLPNKPLHYFRTDDSTRKLILKQ